MKRAKTHPFEDGADSEEREGDGNLSPLPDFTKSPLMITKTMFSNSKNKKKNSSTASSCVSKSDHMTMINRSSSKPRNLKINSSLGSLIAALPLSPSPVCSSPAGSDTIFSSPSSNLPCDYPRPSGGFYTPTHQSSNFLSSISFRKQELSPKRLSMSTAYESVKDHGIRRGAFDSHGNGLTNYTYSPKNLASSLPPHDYESTTTTTNSSRHGGGFLPLLPCVPEEMAGYRQSGGPQPSARTIPVRTDQEKLVEAMEEDEEEEQPTPVNRPKPYLEFLDEVQNHRREVDLSARRKALYTHLLDQLRRKETAIDDWESNQKSKRESQMDKIERKLEKKRAKAVQKMHKKVAEINMEAEKKKARERRSFLKKMDKLSGQVQENKASATIFFHTWSCCCIPGSEDTP